jgi:hypothetical protein
MAVAAVVAARLIGCGLADGPDGRRMESETAAISQTEAKGTNRSPPTSKVTRRGNNQRDGQCSNRNHSTHIRIGMGGRLERKVMAVGIAGRCGGKLEPLFLMILIVRAA